jgi:hypothetical protein
MKFSPLPCYLIPLRPKYSPQHPILKHTILNTLINTDRKYQASFHYSVLIFVSYTVPCSKPRTLELLHFSVEYKNCGVTGMMTGRESYSAVAMVTGTNSRRRGGGKQNILVCQEHSAFHK